MSVPRQMIDLGEHATLSDAITAIRRHRTDVPIALPPRQGRPLEIVLPIDDRRYVRQLAKSGNYADVLRRDHGIIIRWTDASYRAYLIVQAS